MADEQYTIAVTDEGTIDQLVALLQLLGLEGEAASARISSGFTNLSTSQKVAEASTRAFAAAAEAGFTQTALLASAMDKLTTAEQQAVTNLKTLPELVNTLALAADKGVVGAAELTGGLQSLITSSGGVKQALAGQGEAVEGLSRLQIALAERAQAVDAAFLTQIATANSYTTTLNNNQAAINATSRAYTDAAGALAQFEREQLAANISVQGLAGTYSGMDNLLQAYNAELAAATERTQAFAAANASLVTATQGLNVSERETVALLQAFGVTAAEAAQRVTAGFAEANTQIGLSSGQFAILSEAEQTGYKNTQELAQAFGLLSQAELDALSHTSQLDVAITAITASAEKAQSVFAAEAAAIAQDTKAFSDAVAASTALAEAEQRLADINAADAATFAETAASVARYVGSIEAAVDALAGLTGAELKAAEAAIALAKAEADAGAAAVTMGARLAEVKALGAELGQTFGGLNAIFAGAFATSELIKASDAFAKLHAGLGTVVKDAGELNAVYGQLKTTSNETQTSLEANANLYVKIADATKDTALTSGELVKAVGGIDVALKLGNVTGQDAYRVLRSLSEVYTTTSGSAERFLQNLNRESAPTFALISQAAQKLGIDLKEFGSQGENASLKLDKLKDKAAGLQEKLDGPALKSVSAYSAELGRTSGNIDKASTSAEAYSRKLDEGGTLTDKARAKYEALNDKIEANYVANGKAAAGLANAKAAQDAHTQSQLAATNAQIAAAEATATDVQKKTDLTRILEQIYTDNLKTSQSFTTVSGALQVLKNNLTDFAGESDTANASMTVLKDTVLLVASNLNILVPAVIAFGAAVAVIKIATLVQQLGELATKLITVAGAFVAANAEVIIVVAGVGLLALGLEKIYNYFAPVNAQIDLFGSAMKGAGAIADGFGNIVGALSAKITDSAIHTQASKDATNALAGAHGNAANAAKGLGDAITGTDTKVQQFTVHNDAATLGLSKNSTTTSDAAKAYVAAQKAISDASTALIGHAQAADNAERATAANNEKLAIAKQDAADAAAAQRDLNKAVGDAPSLWSSFTSAISSAISKLGDFISTAAQAAAAAAKSLVGGGTSTTPAVSGRARDGGTFTVAGTGPVDSKLIAVSPGEVVTVQTPAQYHAGVLPPADPAQTHFAVGGVTTGAGVDLGTGVAVSAGAAPFAPSGVTGYSQSISTAIGALTVAQNANVSTTTANTATTATNTVATAATTAADTANTAATATNTNATGTNTGAVTANTTALATLSTSVGNAASAFGASTSAANQNSAVTAQNTSAVSGNSSAMGANTQSNNAGTQAAGVNTTALNDNAKAGTEVAGKLVASNGEVVKAANDNTREMAAVITALRDTAQSIVAGCNAVVTADNSLGQTLASAANAIVSAANAMASAAKSAATAQAATAQAATTTTSTQTTTTASNGNDKLDPANQKQGRYTLEQYTADAEAGTRQPNGNIVGASGTIYVPQYTSQYANGQFGGGVLTGYKTSTGVVVSQGQAGISASNTYSDVASAQYQAGQKSQIAGINATAAAIKAQDDEFTTSLPGGAYKINSTGGAMSTQALAGDAATIAQLQLEAQQLSGHARDGGEFFVPGGTGVDSRVLNIAVSPGEAVQVRTPAQQNARGEGGDIHQTVIFQVTTPDAQSFGSSQPQIEAKLVRGLRRINRR